VAAVGIWAHQATVDVAFPARGVVRPEGEVIRVTSEVSGRVVRVHYAEGAFVNRGDTLVELDSRTLRLKRRMIGSQVHAIETRLTQLQDNLAESSKLDMKHSELEGIQEAANLRLLEIGAETAQSRFDQINRLFSEGLVSRQSHEDARANLDRAVSERAKWSSTALDLRKAQSELRLREREVEVGSVRAELAGLYEQLQQCDLDIARLSILSPNDGRIGSSVPLHPGEVLSQGVVIATIIAQGNPLVIESWIPTAERHSTFPGQLVRVRPEVLSSQNDVTFDAVVDSISPDARVTDAMAVYRVILAPTPFAPALEVGASFQVQFIHRQDRLLWLLFHRVRQAFGE